MDRNSDDYKPVEQDIFRENSFAWITFRQSPSSLKTVASSTPSSSFLRGLPESLSLWRPTLLWMHLCMQQIPRCKSACSNNDFTHERPSSCSIASWNSHERSTAGGQDIPEAVHVDSAARNVRRILERHKILYKTSSTGRKSVNSASPTISIAIKRRHPPPSRRGWQSCCYCSRHPLCPQPLGKYDEDKQCWPESNHICL